MSGTMRPVMRFAAGGEVMHTDDTWVRILSCLKEDKEEKGLATNTSGIVVKAGGRKIALYKISEWRIPITTPYRKDTNERQWGHENLLYGKKDVMTIRLSIALSLLSLVYFFCASCSRLGREARIDKGYNLNNVLFVEVDLQSSAYSQHPKSLDFAQQAISRIETIPGVQSAAVVDSLLTSDSYQSRKIYAERAASSEMSLRYFAITPGYFSVVRIPLMSGRVFTDRDGPDSFGVIIISESVARNLFPNEDPIGKRISFSNPPKENSWFTIVGVVGNVLDSGQARAQIYGAYSQEANSKVNIVARTTVQPQSIFERVENEIRRIDVQVRITNIQAPQR